MSFKLSPEIPPNIPEDKIYSIGDFNNYFDQLQKIISDHDDSLAELISSSAGYFPFYKDPVDTIDKVLPVGIYFITPSVEGTFPAEATKTGSFLIATDTLQFLFDSTGIFFRTHNLSQWVKTSGASVIDSLDSASTIDSLSANQGRLLNEGKLGVFSHQSSDTETTNIDWIQQGVHVFINASIEGTLPEFCAMSSGNNNCVIEVFGIQNQTYCQVITDNLTNVRGFRSGTYENGGIAWLDWQQIVVNEAAKNLVIDCGTF